MSNHLVKGAIINVLSFKHPHIDSLIKEGLWGFPDDKHGINRKRWSALEIGMPILLYGDLDGTKGIFLKSTLVKRVESHNPIKYWVQSPSGYPLHIYIQLESGINIKSAQPIKKEELALTIPIFKQRADRWSLMVFGEKDNGITYPINKFSFVVAEFEIRNRRVIVEKPDHDGLKEMLYQMGLIQKKVSKKEVELDGYKVDVAWKRLPKGDPYIVFEVQISGNLEEALTKLKHAHDIWNSNPIVLVTTENQMSHAMKIIEGSFHEANDIFKVLDWKAVKQVYNAKSEYKELERKLGIF